HIIKTLKNQIYSDNIGHAYLFCGTRGTGKTSTAKIFSRAVNWVKADCIENLSTPIIIDQSRLGGNSRSTLGTITDVNSFLRALY
ncbi:hypothetical protein ACTPD5_21915, partial [Clostridioides difficile]